MTFKAAYIASSVFLPLVFGPVLSAFTVVLDRAGNDSDIWIVLPCRPGKTVHLLIPLKGRWGLSVYAILILPVRTLLFSRVSGNLIA